MSGGRRVAARLVVTAVVSAVLALLIARGLWAAAHCTTPFGWQACR
jgi:hypothetical protein